MEDSPMSGLPGPIPPDRGPESSPNEVLTAKLQAQDLQLKALTTQMDQLQHTIQQLASLLTLKNGESTNSSGIAGINTPNSGNLEANPQIFSADTATAPPNPPGNLILGDGIGKELSKRVFSFPENCKLVGASNYDLWKQALIVQFRAIKAAEFISNPEIGYSLPEHEQSVLLLLIKDSLTKEPLESIAWHSSPVTAYKTLEDSYSVAPEISRDSLYREFHALNFSKFRGSIPEFNSRFNSLVARLANANVQISPIDIRNQYLRALEGTFPTWTERQRSTQRALQAIGQNSDRLNLQYLMADLISENSISGSTTAKATNYRAEGRKSGKKGAKKDAKKENNGQDGTSKSRKKGKSTPNSDSATAKDNKSSNSSESNAGTSMISMDFELFTGSIPGDVSVSAAYNALEHAGDSGGNLPYRALQQEVNSAISGVIELCSESDSEPDYTGKTLKPQVLATNSKAKTKPGSGVNRDPKPRRLGYPVLYDTGSTHHIFANKQFFTDYTPGSTVEIGTGGGPVRPIGTGTVKIQVRYGSKTDEFREVTLNNVLYIPSFGINIVNGLIHYNTGGVLLKNTLYDRDRKAWGRLNTAKNSFCLEVKGCDILIRNTTPTVSNYACVIGEYSTASSLTLQGVTEGYAAPLEVKLNNIIPEDQGDYKIYTDSEPEENTVTEELNPEQNKDITVDLPVMQKSSAKTPENPREIGPRRPGKPLDDPFKQPNIKGANTEKEGVSHTRNPLLEPPLVPELVQAPVNYLPLSLNRTTDGWVTAEGDGITGDCDEIQAQKALLWHRRLGHIGLLLLKKTAKNADGLPNFDKIRAITCITCIKTTSVRRTNKGALPTPPHILDSIEGDTVTLKPNPHNKKPVFLLLVDRKSRFRWSISLRNKAGPTVLVAIKGFFKALKATYGRYPTKFHFDGGHEVNTKLQDWFASKGVNFSTSNPYNHGQNGLTERSVRVILDRLRSTILAAGLPLYLWCYLLPAVVDLVNRTAVTNRELTPYEEFYSEFQPGLPHRPNLGHYRVIGTVCQAIIPLEKRQKSNKLAPRTETVRLLAHLSNSTALVYAPARRAVYKTSTVKILEGIPAENLAIPGETLQISEGENPDLEGDSNSEPEDEIYSAKILDPVDNNPLPPAVTVPPWPVQPTVRPPELITVAVPNSAPKITEVPVFSAPKIQNMELNSQFENPDPKLGNRTNRFYRCVFK
ncbi:hypothetical protein MCOR01_011808 [Pyricularia oryzae]|nr:hypothetical protein MCOR01_011808 [Pyricularia oryzae]